MLLGSGAEWQSGLVSCNTATHLVLKTWRDVRLACCEG